MLQRGTRRVNRVNEGFPGRDQDLNKRRLDYTLTFPRESASTLRKLAHDRLWRCLLISATMGGERSRSLADIVALSNAELFDYSRSRAMSLKNSPVAILCPACVTELSYIVITDNGYSLLSSLLHRARIERWRFARSIKSHYLSGSLSYLESDRLISVPLARDLRDSNVEG